MVRGLMRAGEGLFLACRQLPSRRMLTWRREVWCLVLTRAPVTQDPRLHPDDFIHHLLKGSISHTVTWGGRSSTYEFGGGNIIQSLALRELRPPHITGIKKEVQISRDPRTWDRSSYSYDTAMVIFVQVSLSKQFQETREFQILWRDCYN